MYVWNVLRGKDNRVETVEGSASLDAVIDNLAATSWEEPSNSWLSYVTDDSTGEVVATALFGPGLVLLVTLADGRRLTFEMPESYREDMG